MALKAFVGSLLVNTTACRTIRLILSWPRLLHEAILGSLLAAKDKGRRRGVTDVGCAAGYNNKLFAIWLRPACTMGTRMKTAHLLCSTE